MTEVKKTGKIALLFNSRNNYKLFENIFFEHTTVDFSNYYIFNIDLDSTDQEKELGKEVFEKYNIIDIPVDLDDPDIYCASRCMECCIEYIEENNLDIDWILWYSHDCHMVGDDFLERLEQKIEENPRFNEEVGVIGFCDYGTVTVGSPIFGRGTLLGGINEEPHVYWYEHLPDEYKEVEYFVVEAPQDNGMLFNKNLYKKFIEPDYKFILFNWVNDISAQFGLHGVASITIPSLEMVDLYREKPKFGVSRSITCGGHHHKDSYRNASSLSAHWTGKYLYPRASYSSMKAQQAGFDKQEEKYKNSIQEKIIRWHVLEGPKTLDDIKD